LGLAAVQLDTLQYYVKLLLDWNLKVNLVSRKDESNVWVGHILHSLLPLARIEIPPDSFVLDLGTGGGLPGIPVAVARPDLRVTLLDSVRKKTEALQDIVAKLGLKNVEVKWGRAGELKLRNLHIVGFDVVLARAVGPLKDLIKWSHDLVRRNSAAAPKASFTGTKASFKLPFLIAMKGGDVHDEIKKAQIRYKDSQISLVDLLVKGVSEAELVEKKLLVVEL